MRRRRADSSRRDVTSMGTIDTIPNTKTTELGATLDESSGEMAWLHAFLILVLARVVGALLTPILDCDEVFNFWEPLHYQLYGRGMQTWEYSPEHSLRSYAYTSFHAILALLSGTLMGANKVAVFYSVRLLLAMFSAISETFLYVAVSRKVSPLVGTYFLWMLAGSAGLGAQGGAFLPSTWSMYMVTLGTSAWLWDEVELCMLSGCLGVILGWPFSGLAFVPIGLDMLWRRFWRVIRGGLFGVVLCVGICALVDRFAYGKWVIATWNIVKYNVLRGGSELYGIEPWYFYLHNLTLNFTVLLPLSLVTFPLLGTVGIYKVSGVSNPKEPDTAGLLRLPLVRSALSVAGFVIWLGFMSSKPHKEERFMTPVYSLLCLAAALSLRVLVWVGGRVMDVVGRSLCRWEEEGEGEEGEKKRKGGGGGVSFRVVDGIAVAVLLMTALLSSLRLLALAEHYRAPAVGWAIISRKTAVARIDELTVVGDAKASPWTSAFPVLASSFGGAAFGMWGQNDTHPDDRIADPFSSPHGLWSDEPFGYRACVGAEWYRFPSSFFLPDRTVSGMKSVDPHATPGGPLQLAFIRSSFHGELPQPFSRKAGGTSAIPGPFNDMNQEEDVRRFVPLEACDFVIDIAMAGPVPPRAPFNRTQDIRYPPRPLLWEFVNGTMVAPKNVRYDQHFADMDPADLHSHGRRGRPRGKPHPGLPPPAPASPDLTPAERVAREKRNGWEFKSVWNVPFLDASRSSPVARAFRLPEAISDRLNTWGTFHVLQRTVDASEFRRQQWIQAIQEKDPTIAAHFCSPK